MPTIRIHMLPGTMPATNIYVIATLAMVVVLLGVAPNLPDTKLLALIVQTLLGATIYSLVLLTTWSIAGRPQGTEKFLLEHVQRLMHARNNHG